MPDSPTSNTTLTATPPSSSAQTMVAEPVSSNETAPLPNGNVSDATKPSQTAPDDTFTNLDVKSLTPELKAKYDSMLSDYKKKTSEIAQERKRLAEFDQKAKAYDQISADPAFVNYWNGLSKAQQGQIKEDAGISDEEFNKAFESKNGFTDMIKKVAQNLTAQNQSEITNLKADLMIKDFKAKVPDFAELNEDRAIEIQLRADPRTYTVDPKQWEKALEDAVSNARMVRDKWIEKGRKEGLSRVQEKVSQSTNPPTTSPEQLYPGGDPKNLSVSEAIELARRGIKVPRR